MKLTQKLLGGLNKKKEQPIKKDIYDISKDDPQPLKTFLNLLYEADFSNKEDIKFCIMRGQWLSSIYPEELDMKYTMELISFMKQMLR